MSALAMEADPLDQKPKMEFCSEGIQDFFSVLRSLGEGHLWRSLVASAFLSLQLLDGSLGLNPQARVDRWWVSRGVTSRRMGVEIECRHWMSRLQV